MAPFKWLGRVLLWVIFLPVGLWRSIRHSRKKSEARIIDQINKQDRR